MWILRWVRFHVSESPLWGLVSATLQLIEDVLTSTSEIRFASFWMHAVAKGMWRSLNTSKNHSKDRN